MQEAEVVLNFLFPADQQAPGAVEPGVRALDFPAACLAAAVRRLRGFDLFVNRFAFGVVTSESNTSIHHWAGFEGGHFDPDTALTNDDHRWYDPVVGRWISEDPIGFGGGDANIVCYVGNNPVSQVDPVGEQQPNQGPVSYYAGDVAGHATYTPVNYPITAAHSSGTPENSGVYHTYQTATLVNYGQPQKHPTSTPRNAPRQVVKVTPLYPNGSVIWYNDGTYRAVQNIDFGPFPRRPRRPRRWHFFFQNRTTGPHPWENAPMGGVYTGRPPKEGDPLTNDGGQ